MINLERFWYILPLFLSLSSFAQEEFMIYGKAQSNIDSLHIYLYNKDNEKLIEKKVVATGKQYRIYVAYNTNYLLHYEARDHNPAEVLLSTVLPEGTPACCLVPMEINFRLKKQEGNYRDSIFDKPLVNIRYNKSLRNYNYDFDLDYIIEERIMQAELKKRQELQAQKQLKLVNDSLAVEDEYYSFIHCGNRAYFLKQYSQARKCFNDALKMKPERSYPKYKLEDIETEINFGTKRKAIDIDTVQQTPPPTVATAPKQAKPKQEYKLMTDEEIEKKLMGDIARIVINSEEDSSAAIKRLSFLNEILDKEPISVPKQKTVSKTQKTEPEKKQTAGEEEKTLPQITESKEEEKADTARPRANTLEPLVVYTKENKLKKMADERQEELKKKYPKTKTIVLEEDEYKTITRVYIRNDDQIDTYMKVEHKWGATFYFIENYPYPNENITRAYFESATKIR